jgi:hypothetical protein
MSPEETAERLAAGTHALIYRGLDGETYRATYGRESGVGYLDVRRLDGAAFRISGRTVRKYQPLMIRSQLLQFVDSTLRDRASTARLEEIRTAVWL